MEICRADLCESKPLSHNLVITDLMVNDVFDGRFAWGHDFCKRGVWNIVTQNVVSEIGWKVITQAAKSA